jgi:streptogramin lyase
MPKTSRFPALFVSVSAALLASTLAAQTATTIAAGTSFATERDGVVSGVRVDVRPDGAVWFLVPALDRIAVLRDGTTTQWQIRDDAHLGANPVDFEVDGDVVWYLCNGESEIDAGHSTFGRLDTLTGQIHEWEVPGGRPAGFYRAPDGKVWIPHTNQKLQSIDLETLEVVDHRSGNLDGTGTQTIAYSDIILGPDGALWLTDFGNNRIVRYSPGASQEISWTFVDPALAIFSPSQIQFDGEGRLWISQFTGGRIDRFDPSSNEITSFVGFLNPIHFDLFGGRVYVTEAAGSNGQIAVLDPRLAGAAPRSIEPETLEVRDLVNTRPAVVHDRTAIQTTFASPPEAIPAADLPVNVGIGGILRTQLPWTNAYGIEVVGGEVWVGSTGKLARLVLQTVGGGADLVAPVATQLAGAADVESRIDVVLYNPSDTPISGDILYLFSPGFFAARTMFTLAPGQTSLLADAFGDLGSATVPFIGPVRILVTSGPAEELVATVRTAQARADGGSFGYSAAASSVSEALGAGSSHALFTGARESEVSVFGFYTPSGAEAAFTLVAPDGTVRGSLPIAITSNVAEEFSPASSAFGVPAEPGDVIRVDVVSGTLYAYVRIVDAGTTDVALSLPAKATVDAVFPNAGTAVGLFDTSFVSDLFLSNADSASPANVKVSYFPLGSPGAPATATLTLPPGGGRVVANVLETLFGVPVGQGSLLVESDVPVASSLRIAAVKEEGDFSTLALPIEPAGVVESGGDAFVIGELQTATRRTNVLLFNRGAAGIVTVIAYNGNNDEIGRLQVPVGANRAARVDSVLPVLGAAEEKNGRLVLQASEGMVLYAWAAEVDGPTGDVEIVPFR